MLAKKGRTLGSCLAVLLAACSGAEPDPAAPVVLTLDRATAMPLEAVSAHLGGVTAGNGSFEATLGGSPVAVESFPGGLVAFTVPELAPGEYQLSMTVGGKALSAPLTLTAAPEIADPDAHIAAFVLDGRAFADALAAAATTPDEVADAATAKATLDALEAQVASLSADERSTLARTLAVNSSTLGWTPPGAAAKVGFRAFDAPACDDDDPDYAKAAECVAAKVERNTIKAALLAVLRNPFGAFKTLYESIVYTMKKTFQLGVPEGVTLEEGGSSQKAGPLVSSIAAPTLRLASGSNVVPMTVRERSLLASDAGAAFAARARVTSRLAAYAIVADPVAERLGLRARPFSPGAVPAFDEPRPFDETKVTIQFDAGRYPDVAFAGSATSGALVLEASTTRNTETPFQFTVRYELPGWAAVETIVDATVGEDACAGQYVVAPSPCNSRIGDPPAPTGVTLSFTIEPGQPSGWIAGWWNLGMDTALPFDATTCTIGPVDDSPDLCGVTRVLYLPLLPEFASACVMSLTTTTSDDLGNDICQCVTDGPCTIARTPL